MKKTKPKNKVGPFQDEKGRFVPGNKASPGRYPGKKRSRQFRETVMSAVTLEDMVEIVNKLKANAKKGHLQPARILMEYRLGKPSDQVTIEILEQLEAELEEARWEMMKRAKQAVQPREEIQPSPLDVFFGPMQEKERQRQARFMGNN